MVFYCIVLYCIVMFCYIQKFSNVHKIQILKSQSVSTLKVDDGKRYTKVTKKKKIKTTFYDLYKKNSHNWLGTHVEKV